MFQHYVPKTYLVGFTASDTSPGHEPSLWVTDKKLETQKRRSPKNVAGDANFYEQLGSTNGPGKGLEGRLAKIERSVRENVLQMERDFPQTTQLSYDFCWFLTTLCVRTPWAKLAVEDHLRNYPPTGSLSNLDSSERWAASVEYLASWAQEYFRRMEWSLCGSVTSEDFFITSDRPVVLTGNNVTDSVVDVLRLTEGSSLVTVPVSARLALIGSYSRDDAFQGCVTTSEINDRTFDHAERFVFSPEELQWEI